MKKNPLEEAFNTLVDHVRDLYRQEDGSTGISDTDPHDAANRLIKFGRLALEIEQRLKTDL